MGHPDGTSHPDVVLMTQHKPVYTLGTGSTLDNLRFSPDQAPFDVVRTERGGEVTYHGPGQVRNKTGKIFYGTKKQQQDDKAEDGR